MTISSQKSVATNFSSWGYSTREDLGAVLENLLERAREAPFYRKRFQGNSPKELVQNWRDIPFTLKSDLMTHSPDGFRALPLEKIFHYHESFGTVGAPMSSWYTTRDFDFLPAIAGRWAEAFEHGQKILNRFPYSFPVPAPLVESIARQKGGIVIPAGHLNWNVSYQRTLELIQKLQPQILCGLPLEPMILWELADYLRISPTTLQSVEHICLSGGILTPAFIETIEDKWQAKVHNVYGSTEASGMASSCSHHRLHFHSDHYLFEVVSPAAPHAPVPENTPGILVVTTLTREAMPLVRYFTRDWVRVETDECPCGAKEKTLTLLGRIDDTLHHSGKLFFKYDLDQAIQTFANTFGCSIYFVIVASKGLIIRLEVDQKPIFVAKEPIEQLERQIGLPVQIEFVARDTLLHRPSMLKTPQVFKPQTLSDWRHQRNGNRRVSSISEALIEWPRYSCGEIVGLFKRSLRRLRNRRRFRKYNF